MIDDPGLQRKPHVNPIARFAVERRVTMGMGVLGVLVLGAVSLARLPLEFLPSFSSSNIRISAPWPSASPEETERRIVRPLEDVLGTINGIETLSATASSGEGSVNLTFEDGTDMDMAAVEVRDRIDRVRHLLPPDLRRVLVRRFQTTDLPVLRFHASADWGKSRLYRFIEEVVQRRMERLEGVAQVNVRGLLQPEVRVDLIPSRLQAHGIDVRQVSETLRAGHLNLSAGWIDEGSRRLLVRSVGEFKGVQEIRDQPIGNTGRRIGDVAEVSYSYPRQDEFNYLNGREALTVQVYKSSTANLLAVADRVKAELAEIRKMPEAEGLNLRVFRDSSSDVRQGLGQLRDAGILGGVLAVAFLFLFLRKFRTTLLVALAIPISIVLTFVFLYLLRQAGLSTITLNIMSLMGLMMAVGMLVDNSVVVIESIFRHVQDLGEDSRTAALHGTSEVAMPIVAATATTVCVFAPIIFMGGGGGFMRFIVDVGVTVCVVMVASLVVALTVVPMAAAFLLRGESKRRSGFVDGLGERYSRIVDFTLRHRPAFLTLAFGMLIGSVFMFSGIERTFTGRSEERQVSFRVDTPRNFSLEQTEALFDEVAGILEAHREELEIADVVYEYDRVGGKSRGGFGGGGQSFDLFLVDEADATQSTSDIREKVRALLPERPGVRFRLDQGRGHGGGGSGITMELSGDDPAVLELVSGTVVDALRGLPWLKDLDTSLESGDEEIHVKVRRERALQAGLTTRAVANTVASALSTRPVSQLKAEDREVDLVVQFREEDRRTLRQLENLPVASTSGRQSIGSLADFSVEKGPSTIQRENRQPKLTITANTEGSGTSFRMMGEVQQILNQVSLPPGYSWSFGRWERFAQQDQQGSRFAMYFAALLVFLIMAALFESFVQPFVIMLSIPFAFIGVGVVMRLGNQSFDNNTTLGLVILLGVVVNNAIVLIDHVNHLRLAGMTRRQALVQGGRDRLRPILMTALTTILGLLPMVLPIFVPGLLGSAEGNASNWAPVGLVILGGLTTSTFLTLLIIPTFYSLVDDLAAFFRRVVHSA